MREPLQYIQADFEDDDADVTNDVAGNLSILRDPRNSAFDLSGNCPVLLSPIRSSNTHLHKHNQIGYR